MRKVISFALAGMLALAPALSLTGCGGFKQTTSGGIVLEEVERDKNGYIAEDAVKKAALAMADIYDEALCTYVDTKLDTSSDPARWIVDFDQDGTSYRYVVNAENGDLIDFSTLSL